MDNSTICAVSTAVGTGAISIVRCSGVDAIKIVNSIFKGKDLEKVDSHTISYGHIGADLITLCSILRIPVAMHNVADKDIFRPKAWDAFGMDKEGADYRACAVYGPMYK